jgi:two-component system sensor histidine kinase KdpD
MSDPELVRTLPSLIALLVHDLRNPVATIGANVGFLADAAGADGDPELEEAVLDTHSALADLARGLEHLAWLGRALEGLPVAEPAAADVIAAVRAAASKPPRGRTPSLALPEGVLRARGATMLPRLLEILLANAAHHAPDSTPTVAVREDGDDVVVEVRDEGRALAEELRASAFTATGQLRLKDRGDGRYGRAVGLYAARLLADAMGARVEGDGVDGAAVFRVRLRRE